MVAELLNPLTPNQPTKHQSQPQYNNNLDLSEVRFGKYYI